MKVLLIAVLALAFGFAMAVRTEFANLWIRAAIGGLAGAIFATMILVAVKKK
jgi:hypothetical protein